MQNFRNNVSFYNRENSRPSECSRKPESMMDRRDHLPDTPCYHMDGLSKMPLAMAYVPWQIWQNLYDADKGFHCGTIFQDLHKPFEHAGGGCR